MNTQENNDKIALYMGLTARDGWYDGWDLVKAGLPFNMGAGGNGMPNIPFDKSWEYLMPVVDKIEKELPDTSILTIEYHTCIIPLGENSIFTNMLTKREAVYQAVLQYVEWVNNKKIALEEKKLTAAKELQKQKDTAAMEREKLKAKTALKNPVTGERKKK